MSYSATLIQGNIIQGRKLIVFLLILLIVLFIVLYIVQINSVATGGYRIREYKNEIGRLQLESKNLELSLSEIRSISFLEEKIKDLDMVKSGDVEYISLTSEVAAR